MSVKEIEVAINRLTVAERSELIALILEQHHDDWDKQIADDLDSGRLDAVLAEVDREYDAGLAKPFRERK